MKLPEWIKLGRSDLHPKHPKFKDAHLINVTFLPAKCINTATAGIISHSPMRLCLSLVMGGGGFVRINHAQDGPVFAQVSLTTQAD